MRNPFWMVIDCDMWQNKKIPLGILIRNVQIYIKLNI